MRNLFRTVHDSISRDGNSRERPAPTGEMAPLGERTLSARLQVQRTPKGGRAVRHGMRRSMRYLVTGGAGFIGSNLSRLLLAEGHEVRVIDDLSSGSEANLRGLDVDLAEGSILDTTLLDRASVGCHSVVHLAGRGSVPRSLVEPEAYVATNVQGTFNVLESARHAGVGRVIFSSSSSVYGANEDLPKTEHSWTRPISPYAATKLAAESLVSAYASAYGMDNISFRLFNVYGPGQRFDHAYAAVVPKWIRLGLDEQPIPVFGDGLQSRDFTFVDSVCRVLYRASSEDVLAFPVANLAWGSPVNLLQIAAGIEAALDIPLSLDHREVRHGDIRDSMAAPSEFLLSLGVEPVALNEGLTATANWIRAL